MLLQNKNLIALTFLLFAFTFSARAQKTKDYGAIVNHLKTKYQAKKVKIPLMFLARFAVSVVRPAGVKSFNITLFENLKFSAATLDREMQAAMRNAMTAEWNPILRVRSRDGQQAYMYMKDAGDSVKIMLVTIDKTEAAVIRATFSPEKLDDFINNPKIFGISLSDSGERQASDKNSEAKEDRTFYEKSTEKDDTRVIEDKAHAAPVRLFKFDVKSEKVTRLTDNADRINYFYLSPEGNRAVTVHAQSLTYSYDNKTKPHVFLYDLKTGERKQIFNEPKFNIDDIVWAKDGKGFYASNDFKENPRYLWAVLTELYYYDLERGAPVKVNLDWENGLTGGFVATGDGFIALLANGVRDKIARYVKTGDEWRREWLTGEHAGNIFRIVLGKDDKTLVYNYSTASTPAQWYRAFLDNTKIQSPTQITDINKNLQKKEIAKTEIVHWKGALDEEVEGVLYYPHDYKAGKNIRLL